jgi:hypothetical protein
MDTEGVIDIAAQLEQIAQHLGDKQRIKPPSPLGSSQSRLTGEQQAQSDPAIQELRDKLNELIEYAHRDKGLTPPNLAGQYSRYKVKPVRDGLQVWPGTGIHVHRIGDDVTVSLAPALEQPANAENEGETGTGPTEAGFWAEINSFEADMGLGRYAYNVTEVTPGDIYYDDWEIVSGGRTVTARNTCEQNNSTAGIDPGPVPVGEVVYVRLKDVELAPGVVVTAYWFTSPDRYVNGVCKITANNGSGAYTITRLRWNGTAYVADESGAIYTVAARDYQNRPYGAVSTHPVRYWETIKADGSLERLIDIGPVGYGKPSSAFSSGSTVTLVPCDADGTTITGASNVTAYVQPSKASYTMPNSTTIPTSEIVHYTVTPAGTFVVGRPQEVVVAVNWSTSADELQYKMAVTWGAFRGTDSAFLVFPNHDPESC